jgi:hypothetical protein
MTSHGHTRNRTTTPTYRTWVNMLTRCENPKASQYADYGARGIKVSEHWRSFDNFLADMGERPIGTTLDRIENDGDYDRNNCRWATHVEQCRKRRSSRAVVRSDGAPFPTLAEAAESVAGTIGGIWDACNGKAKTHRGFGWGYQ